MTARRSRSTGSRLSVIFALASAVPTVLLGAVLATTLRQDALTRTLANGETQAQLLAETAVAPALASRNLDKGLDVAALADLGAAVDNTTREGRLVHLVVRAPSGAVVFPPTVAGRAPDAANSSPADVAAAARGDSIARVTTVEASADHAAGQVIRVLTPVNAPADDRLIGVLEVDLPYQVVAAAVQAQARRLMVVLGLGLLGQYLVVAGISWVVTRRLRRQSDLHEYLANHDALTELPNRKLFRYHAETALERAAATDTSCCVAIVDLDRFKEVNDTLGHHVGDQLLRQVAERMRRALRTDDTVARLGGDEFGLVLPGTNAEQAVPVLEAIRKAVGADLLLAGLTMSVGSSFGVSSYPDQGNNVDILLQQADVAMYAAKAGQRGVVAYDPTIVPIGPDHLELASDLRRGIEHDELVLHYQPQLRLRDGAVTTVEALVRWQHPQRGLLYPDSFIEVAEQNDLVNALTYRVLRTALQQVLVWDAQGHRLRVAVNVSAHTMHDESFPGSVAALLAEAGLPTSRLLLELTETALVSDPAKVRSVMLALSDLGIALSLDDFGQGYTSLSFLRGLPLVEIKVDKAFVIGMGTGPDDAIVKSVIGLAHGLGLTVVAEGVEEQGVLDALRHMGCDIAQGYHIGRPVLPSELTAWLDAASDRLPLPLGRS